jgi:branched-chain amino acid aminotransferase
LPEELTFLNGEIVAASEALIPVSDRAVLYGDSVFETLRSYSGRPFRLHKHLERLFEGCRLMRLEPPMPAAEIEVAVAELLEANGLDAKIDAYVRITITGGPTAGPKGLRRPGEAGIFIIAHPYEAPPPQDHERGISVTISGIKRNASSPLSGIKSGNGMDGMFARQEAYDRGFDDAVMLTSAGNVAEGPSWNVFMVKDSELLTPNMGCGFLPGITREAIIEVSLEQGLPVKEIMEGTDALTSCEEAFATASTIEVMPISQFGTHLMTFCPGPVTRQVMQAYRELVRRETTG